MTRRNSTACSRPSGNRSVLLGSLLLANIYLTAIDERYGRWSLRPRERPQNSADRRLYDRRRGRPTFFAVRYADDFVVCTDGTFDEAEAETGDDGSDGAIQLQFFWEGGTSHFPHRGTRIPNGWNADPDEWFRPGADQFWTAFNTLARL